MAIGFVKDYYTLYDPTNSKVLTLSFGSVTILTTGTQAETSYKVEKLGDDVYEILAKYLYENYINEQAPNYGRLEHVFWFNGRSNIETRFYSEGNYKDNPEKVGCYFAIQLKYNNGSYVDPYGNTAAIGGYAQLNGNVLTQKANQRIGGFLAYVETSDIGNVLIAPFQAVMRSSDSGLFKTTNVGYTVNTTKQVLTPIIIPRNFGQYPVKYIFDDYNTLSNVTTMDSVVDEVYGFPYGDGESTSQGGQGEMKDTSDPIEIDSKPLLTTGDFLRIYKLTATDLSALQAKLISNGFLDNLIAKLRTDAMDYIVGLNAIPISATNVAASTIKIANLDTGINASYLSWYIEDIDFGEIALTEYFQTFMDYSPYTKLSVYIPYCGIVPLNVDQFMNDKIKLKCRVDMLTGQFVVFVSNSVGVITTVSGNCAYQLPVRSNDYNNVVTRGLAVIGGLVGTAGALASGNIPIGVGLAGASIAGAVSLASATEKPNVYSNGSLGGNFGLLGNRTPYLIIQRPTISVPSDYGKTIGYMSRITAKLGDLSGFTVVEEIHLEHISATDDEKRLIENALKSGVIL